LFSAEAPYQTPLAELTSLPRPPGWIKGPTSKGSGGDIGREGKGRKGRGARGEGK